MDSRCKSGGREGVANRFDREPCAGDREPASPAGPDGDSAAGDGGGPESFDGVQAWRFIRCSAD